jgi:hypothetical protein
MYSFSINHPIEYTLSQSQVIRQTVCAIHSDAPFSFRFAEPQALLKSETRGRICLCIPLAGFASPSRRVIRFIFL